jgi:hypothetical protein
MMRKTQGNNRGWTRTKTQEEFSYWTDTTARNRIFSVLHVENVDVKMNGEKKQAETKEDRKSNDEVIMKNGKKKSITSVASREVPGRTYADAVKSAIVQQPSFCGVRKKD